MSLSLTPHPGKSCGSCTACCTVMAVNELGKGIYEHCQHLRPVIAKDQGCQIYQSRPASCRIWSCSWLCSDMAEDMRPNRCGVVINPLTAQVEIEGKVRTARTINAMTGFEEAFRTEPVRSAVLAITKEMPVLWLLPPVDGKQEAFVLTADDGVIALEPAVKPRSAPTRTKQGSSGPHSRQGINPG